MEWLALTKYLLSYHFTWLYLDPQTAPVTAKMHSIDVEDQLYDEEVKAVKQWWTDPRWRYTRRPFTAEQIVVKRGNLRIEYPSNVQSKKLWKILEERHDVWLLIRMVVSFLPCWCHFLERRRKLYIRSLGANYAHADGQISGYCLCLWMAMLFDGFINRWAFAWPCWLPNGVRYSGFHYFFSLNINQE